jgi:hypothetical protein
LPIRIKTLHLCDKLNHLLWSYCHVKLETWETKGPSFNTTIICLAWEGSSSRLSARWGSKRQHRCNHL